MNWLTGLGLLQFSMARGVHDPEFR